MDNQVDLLVSKYLISKGFFGETVCRSIISHLTCEDQWSLVVWCNREEACYAEPHEQPITTGVMDLIPLSEDDPSSFLLNATRTILFWPRTHYSVIARLRRRLQHLQTACRQYYISLLSMELFESDTVPARRSLEYLFAELPHTYFPYTQMFERACFAIPVDESMSALIYSHFGQRIDFNKVFRKALQDGRMDVCDYVNSFMGEEPLPQDHGWLEYLRHLIMPSSDIGCTKCREDHHRLWVNSKLSGTPVTRNKTRQQRNLFLFESNQSLEPVKNDVDPFTLENVESMPKFMQFLAQDEDEDRYTYVFDLPSLQQYFEDEKYTNPITRRRFKRGTVERCKLAFFSLRKLMSFYDHKCQCIL